jgi:hypothetical protein
MKRMFTLALPLFAISLLACGPPQSAATSSKASTASPAAAPSGPMPTDCHYGKVGAVSVPDLGCTPGATDPLVTQANVLSTICRTGYAATVQLSASSTASLKRQLMVAYHLTGPADDYELDHLVPLEVGGAPSAATNLWPQLNSHPASNVANVKDPVEDYVHHAVCTGAMTLTQGQEVFLTGQWAAMVDKPEIHPVVPHSPGD